MMRRYLVTLAIVNADATAARPVYLVQRAHTADNAARTARSAVNARLRADATTDEKAFGVQTLWIRDESLTDETLLAACRAAAPRACAVPYAATQAAARRATGEPDASGLVARMLGALVKRAAG